MTHTPRTCTMLPDTSHTRQSSPPACTPLQPRPRLTSHVHRFRISRILKNVDIQSLNPTREQIEVMENENRNQRAWCRKEEIRRGKHQEQQQQQQQQQERQERRRHEQHNGQPRGRRSATDENHVSPPTATPFQSFSLPNSNRHLQSYRPKSNVVNNNMNNNNNDDNNTPPFPSDTSMADNNNASIISHSYASPLAFILESNNSAMPENGNPNSMDMHSYHTHTLILTHTPVDNDGRQTH